MEISVNGQTFTVERVRLRRWLQLEETKSQIHKAAERLEVDTISDQLISYLSAASGIEPQVFEDAPWFDSANAFSDLVMGNEPTIKFPLLENQSDQRGKPVVWDYVGRLWFSWVNLIATAYGWGIEQIENLEVDTGIALIQEILVEHQLKREWEWSLTELAYPYDPGAKKGIFKPLTRPRWMRGKPERIKKVRMPLSILPVGIIEDLAGVGLHGQDIDKIKH